MIRSTLSSLALAVSLGAAVIASPVAAQAPSATPAAASNTNVVVHLRGMKPGKGAAIILLFDSEQNYDANKAVQSTKIDATAATADHTFSGLTPGRYAIRAFYDVNSNGAYDQGTDGIAFSNHVIMSDANQPPTFSDASFMVRTGANAQQLTFAVVN